jgi:hypothetical protein
MFISDPGSDFFPSQIRTVSIPDPGSASKNLSILTPKKPKKWFLSSRKYNPGRSSRIRIRNTDFKGCRCTIHVGSLTTSLLLKEENTSDIKQRCGSMFIKYGSGIYEEVWVRIQDDVFNKKICEVVYDFDFMSKYFKPLQTYHLCCSHKKKDL